METSIFVLLPLPCVANSCLATSAPFPLMNTHALTPARPLANQPVWISLQMEAEARFGYGFMSSDPDQSACLLVLYPLQETESIHYKLHGAAIICLLWWRPACKHSELPTPSPLSVEMYAWVKFEFNDAGATLLAWGGCLCVESRILCQSQSVRMPVPANETIAQFSEQLSPRTFSLTRSITITTSVLKFHRSTQVPPLVTKFSALRESGHHWEELSNISQCSLSYISTDTQPQSKAGIGQIMQTQWHMPGRTQPRRPNEMFILWFEPNQNPTERRYLGQWITLRIPNENKVLIHTHAPHVHEPRCVGERREQRRRREGRGRMHVRGHVRVRHRVWVWVHVPTVTVRTAQGLHAAAACAGSSRGSHRASDVESPAPAAPESIESASSPVPLTQSVKILYRLSQPFFSSPPLLLSPIHVPVHCTHPRPFHALPLALLSASTAGSRGAKQHTPCARWYLSPFHDSDLGASIYKSSLGLSRSRLREEITNTLVGLEGTGFVLVVSSSTGAAWELFRDGGGCLYGLGGKGWLTRMSSSGGGAGAVQAHLYYIACHEHILTMMKMVVYMCTVAIVLFAVTWI
ncbi:hypothetical protein JB92DRAFT_2827339 [Gautieria morchelliformis]|nr:hypothetical protein JB92DRAFT_2827339 [Gautieria morchelliformis]